MKDFFKMLFASCLGNILVFVIGIFIVIGLIGGIIASALSIYKDGNSTFVVEDNSVLRLDLNKTILERTPSELENYINTNQVMGLDVVLKSIYRAKNDDKIKGIYLKTSGMYNGGWAVTEEIRNALLEFKKEGKFVYSYSDIYGQKAYYLSSVADSVYINPSGVLEFKGIGAETLFIKDLLDKLDVDVKLIRPSTNSFKSAGEMYTMNKMSEANKTQIRAYIKSIWNHVLEDISHSRNISVNELNTIANDLSAYLPQDALEKKLVDKLCFEHDALVSVAQILNIEDNNPSDIKFVSAANYVNSLNEELDLQRIKDKIAIIYAQGDVLQGKGTGVNVYSSNIVNAIEKAVSNDDVKAIVLRVNSPGGAVIASEIMTNAVVRAKEKKPIVVSMSDVAASAGYEISCYANKIVAMPTTITGSIGVFGIYPEVGTMLKNKFGITSDTVLTNKNSAALSTMRPLSRESQMLLTRNVENFYKTFCSRVAEGRNLSVKYVDSIARGRVWTGVEAKKLGLVDELGGLDVALRLAADEAGVEHYSVIVYPKEKDAITQLMEIIGDEGLTMKYEIFNPDVEVFQNWIEKIANMESVQARLPYYIDF